MTYNLLALIKTYGMGINLTNFTSDPSSFKMEANRYCSLLALCWSSVAVEDGRPCLKGFSK